MQTVAQNMNKNSNNKELTRLELKAKLGHGGISMVATVADVDRVSVYRWFKHQSDNSTIRDAIYAVIQNTQEKLNKRLEEISK